MKAALERGCQLDVGSFDFLKQLPGDVDPEVVMEYALDRAAEGERKLPWLTREALEEAWRELESKRRPPEPPPVGLAATRRLAEDVEAEVEVLLDPTSEVGTGASLEDFLSYFRDRFLRMERLVRKRLDARDALTVERALKAPPNTPFKVIGMVSEKRERRGVIRFQLEDLEAAATVIVPPSAERSLIAKAQRTLQDQVVCIAAVRTESDLLIATDIIWPDLPERSPNKADIGVAAALISDIHIGSRTFLRRPFEGFLQWLRGEAGDARLRELSGRVKYLVIAGDLVDGIGVYPGQEDELSIQDIYEQYKVVASYIEQVPDYIEVIVIPGNHDAVRQALPQPSIPRKYAEPLYEKGGVRMLGNPAIVKLHGVNILIYHGRSLDDVIASVPRSSFQHPEEAMELLLRGRHLSPIYGERTPIAPEARDLLVIEDPPDVFHAGHIHVAEEKRYRGTLVVNSGAWQGQTEYQRKNGLTPTPGIIPIVDLATVETTTIDFTGEPMVL